MKNHKKQWLMGLAAASMAVLLAGCGNTDMDAATSDGGMSSNGSSSIGDTMPEPTSEGTDSGLMPGTDGTGEGNAHTNGSQRSILPDGNNTPGFNN